MARARARLAEALGRGIEAVARNALAAATPEEFRAEVASGIGYLGQARAKGALARVFAAP